MNFDVYLACLANAVLHRRTAVQIELAVGLCNAHDLVKDPVQARVMLTAIYASAGYDCLVPDGRDYKTINRRVNISMLLFETLGAGKVKKALNGTEGHRRVEAMQQLLEPLHLYTYDDVNAFCGRPRVRGAAAVAGLIAESDTPTPKARRAADQPGVVHVRTANLDVPLPPTVTRVEIMQLVDQLLKIANTFNGEPSKRRRPGRARKDATNV